MAKLGNTIDRTMFYGASPVIFERAKKLRLRPTVEERSMWSLLKNKQILRLKFRRQHPISSFIADFYCHQIKLVIEVDGDSHLSEAAKKYDEGRTALFNHFGITVIRFTNTQISEKVQFVQSEIENKCFELL